MATATLTKLQNFINGELVDPAEGATEEVVNPATGEAIAEAPLSSEEDVGRAVAAARDAFDGWAAKTPGDRSLALLEIADLIEERAEEGADSLPAGVLNVIAGHGEPAGSSLVTHSDVDMVCLTGSPPTGRWIAKSASDTLKRVHLELGGKAPVVVFDDVEMETAMETIAGTGYYNAGQDCTAATRVLAGKGVYDDVVSGLAEQAKGLVLGDTSSEETTLGPLNSERQRERVEGFLERKPANAEVVTGGAGPALPGSFLQPAVTA